jgi:hypothetical protein
MKRLKLEYHSAGLALLLFSIANIAAAATGTGSLIGVARGPGGVGLPGATINVRSADAVETASVVTGESGAFRIDNLEPGTYTVEGEIHGFHPTSASAVAV